MGELRVAPYAIACGSPSCSSRRPFVVLGQTMIVPSTPARARPLDGGVAPLTKQGMGEAPSEPCTPSGGGVADAVGLGRNSLWLCHHGLGSLDSPGGVAADLPYHFRAAGLRLEQAFSYKDNTLRMCLLWTLCFLCWLLKVWETGLVSGKRGLFAPAFKS